MKKRFLRWFGLFAVQILALVFIVGLSACSVTGDNSGRGGNSHKTEFASGTGTAEDPYVIKEEYQWLNIANYPTAYFELGNDINLGDYEKIAPIGTSEDEFKGTIDGKGYSVKGAAVRGDHSVGLFGILSGATIKNLGFSDSTVRLLNGYNDGEYLGSFAAIARKGSVLENCFSKNINMSFVSNTGDFTMVGGFVGSLESASSAIFCSCDVKITLTKGRFPGFYVGGFARLVSGSTIDCCSVTGSMTFDHYAGSYVMRIGTFVDRVINSSISNMSVEMNINVGPTIDVYTIACNVDEETLKYCLNFSSYQRSTQGRYDKCGVVSNASEDYNIYFGTSQYSSANSVLENSLWENNKYWKAGKLHPELISYEEYLKIKEAE